MKTIVIAVIRTCMLSHLVVSDSLQHHGLQPARIFCPWDSPGKNTGVGCHVLLQRIFPTQGSNLCPQQLLYCRQILYQEATGKPPVMIIKHNIFEYSQSSVSVGSESMDSNNQGSRKFFFNSRKFQKAKLELAKCPATIYMPSTMC